MTTDSQRKTTTKITAKKTAVKASEATAKKVAKKPAVSTKGPPAKKATKKTSIKPKEATVKKVAKNSATTAKPQASSISITSEERWKMIAIAAYHKAEQRGFAPGGEMQDWAEAENEVDELLTSG